MSTDGVLGRIHADERGMGIVMALLAVVIVGGLAVVFVATTTTQLRASGDARDREEALHVAEAGAELVFGQLPDDPDYVTEDANGDPHQLPSGTACDAVEADWVEDHPPDEGDETVLEEGNRLGYGIRPLDANGQPCPNVLGLGEVGGEDGAVRVVAYEIVVLPVSPQHAIESEYDLVVQNSGHELEVGGAAGSAHGNADVTFSANPQAHIEQGVSSVGSCDDSDVTIGGDPAEECDEGVAEQRIGPYDPAMFYAAHLAAHEDPDDAAYDVCDLAGGPPLREPSPDGPCTGDPVTDIPAWFAQWVPDPSGVPTWTWDYDSALVADPEELDPQASVYVHEANAEVSFPEDIAEPIELTLFVSWDDDEEGGDLDLDMGGDDDATTMVPHLSGLLLVVDGDLEVHSANGVQDPVTGEWDGGSKFGAIDDQVLISGGNRVSISGSGLFDVFGSIVAQSRDHLDHPLAVSGSFEMTVHFDGDLDLPVDPRVRITSWEEL